eukprot:scaffold87710_cov16-Tisochrysis_lutea.AAC.1
MPVGYFDYRCCVLFHKGWWNGMEWNRMEWNGMEQNRLKAERVAALAPFKHVVCTETTLSNRVTNCILDPNQKVNSRTCMCVAGDYVLHGNPRKAAQHTSRAEGLAELESHVVWRGGAGSRRLRATRDIHEYVCGDSGYSSDVEAVREQCEEGRPQFMGVYGGLGCFRAADARSANAAHGASSRSSSASPDGEEITAGGSKGGGAFVGAHEHRVLAGMGHPEHSHGASSQVIQKAVRWKANPAEAKHLPPNIPSNAATDDSQPAAAAAAAAAAGIAASQPRYIPHNASEVSPPATAAAGSPPSSQSPSTATAPTSSATLVPSCHATMHQATTHALSNAVSSSLNHPNHLSLLAKHPLGRAYSDPALATSSAPLTQLALATHQAVGPSLLVQPAAPTAGDAVVPGSMQAGGMPLPA